MPKFTKAIAAAIMVCGLGAAHATTVTFTPLTSPDAGPAGDGTTYLEAGMTFTSSESNPLALVHWGEADSRNADPGGATLAQNFPGESVIVTQTGGGSFFLQSFDLADLYNTGDAGYIEFSYADGSGTHDLLFKLDGEIGLQTFVLGFAGVTSFSLRQDLPYFQLDNVVVGVPEPQTYVLMIAGLLAVGAMWRRQRRGSQV